MNQIRVGLLAAMLTASLVGCSSSGSDPSDDPTTPSSEASTPSSAASSSSTTTTKALTDPCSLLTAGQISQLGFSGKPIHPRSVVRTSNVRGGSADAAAIDDVCGYETGGKQLILSIVTFTAGHTTDFSHDLSFGSGVDDSATFGRTAMHRKPQNDEFAIVDSRHIVIAGIKNTADSYDLLAQSQQAMRLVLSNLR